MRSALKPRRGGEREHSRPVDSLVIWLNPQDSSLISTTGSVSEPNDLAEKDRWSPRNSGGHGSRAESGRLRQSLEASEKSET